MHSLRNRASLFLKFSIASRLPVPLLPFAASPASLHANRRTVCYSSASAPYQSVRIKCRKNVADTLTEALLCFGASSASIDEQGCIEHLDNEIFISSIFSGDQDLDRCISKAADSVGLEDVPHYEVTTGKDCDWVKNSQETFHPVNLTDDLWIIPSWRTPPNVHATNVILNPGLAFGTGDHPTTKLCLLFLHELVKGGERFLDYGTGSGVLSIAALKLGAALSVGVDIDPQAITSACQNAALNDIQPDKMHLYLGSRMVCLHSLDGHMEDAAREEIADNKEIHNEKGKFDIVIANILLNPLLELADDIVGYVKPGGVIGISGILCEQVPQIEECYAKYLDNIIVSEMDGWACVKGTKKIHMEIPRPIEDATASSNI